MSELASYFKQNCSPWNRICRQWITPTALISSALGGLDKFQSKSLGIKRAFYPVRVSAYLTLKFHEAAFQNADPTRGQNDT